MGKEVLRTVGLVKKFGEFVAVNKVSMTFEEGERTAIIGPNGAGKTTFINLVTGQLTPTAGQVFLNGREITSLSPHERVRMGLNRTFQIPSVFKSLTVEDNLRVAASVSPVDSSEVGTIVDRLGLRPYLNMRAALLPYGMMKVLELAMVMLSKPRVVFLDEPTAGLQIGEKVRIVSILQSLPENMTLVVVEHDMDVVFRLARRIVVMHRGEILADDVPEKIASDPRVKEVYLG